MKKRLIKLLMLLPMLGVVFIQSCGEEDPEMVLKVQTLYDYGSKEVPNVGDTPCPNPGTNCKMAVTGTAEQRKLEFEIFKTYYNNKDLKTYFELRDNYEILLPGVDYTDIISKIAQGIYLVKILKNNAIIVYKNDQKELSYDNLVFVFDPNIPDTNE
jgi:hypothetical protein